jgi:hypothetical protein
MLYRWEWGTVFNVRVTASKYDLKIPHVFHNYSQSLLSLKS